jgi:DNA-binding LacI/PurR family transcriptional regulator
VAGKEEMADETNARVQLKDVAQAAGVSPATASMVFNGTGRISPATKAEVLAAARSMGYEHPVRSRRKSKRRTPVAGILVSTDKKWSFVWHFISAMIRTIELEAEALGFRTVIIPISYEEGDGRLQQKIEELACQAVFAVHIARAELFDNLQENGIPVILIFNNNYQDRFSSICVDDFQGAYEGVRYLLRLGHSRIDFVDADREDLAVLSTDRYYGYRKALEEAGVVFKTEHRIGCEDGCTEDDLEERFKAILGRDESPTALYCLDDEIALRALNALQRIGYSVPEDISVLAPGDVLDYSKPYIPPISTMFVDTTYVGRLAVEMLKNRMESESGSVHVLKVKQQLVDRGSCRAPLRVAAPS